MTANARAPRETEPPGSTWAGSHDYGARALVRPRSVEEVQHLVASEPHIRALGSRHSFTDVADTVGLLVALDRLDGAPEMVGDDVRVPAGMRYGDLATWLHARGRALANLASLPHISVAGAVATGTHGSGLGNGSLATEVSAVELVDGRGDLVRITGADLAGAVVSLGALGIVTHLELRTEPTYDVAQTVRTGLTWEDVHGHAADILRSAYSVSIFTRWADEPDGSVARVWTKARVDGPGGRDGRDHRGVLDDLGRPATEALHVLPGLDPAPCTEQLGVPGPWHERIPHFRLDFTPSDGEELQSEYLLPFEHTAEALAAVRGVADQIRPLLMVGEIRAVRGDDLWLSPAYGTDSLALHFTWHRDADGVRAVLPALEEAIRPFRARPHWGKVFTTPPEDIAKIYPRWDDFKQAIRTHDPDGRFNNTWLRHVFR